MSTNAVRGVDTSVARTRRRCGNEDLFSVPRGYQSSRLCLHALRTLKERE